MGWLKAGNFMIRKKKKRKTREETTDRKTLIKNLN